VRSVLLCPATVSTLAGSGSGGYADGFGTWARFCHCRSVAIDSGHTIYVADAYNHRIRTVSMYGETKTLAGSGVEGLRDGYGTRAQFNCPSGVAVDSKRNVYVSDGRGCCIRKIAPDGYVSTWVGVPHQRGWVDSPAQHTHATAPVSLVTAAASTSTNGTVATLPNTAAAPSPVPSPVPVGPPLFNLPQRLAVDRHGNLYVADLDSTSSSIASAVAVRCGALVQC
jgi:hypothetical protein